MTIDGDLATIGQSADPEHARIAIDGVPLPVAPGLVYVLAYKPQGMVTTTDDPQGRATVMDLVPDEPRVFPVGRLDVDSEGLLVLTNDGDLALRLTHPRYGVTKTYTALVSGVPSRRAMRALLEGIELDDGPARAVSAAIIAHHGANALLQIVMAEGRKREVRRMCDAVGHPVIRLVRTAIGPLQDRELRPGTVRSLTVHEVRALYAAAGAEE